MLAQLLHIVRGQVHSAVNYTSNSSWHHQNTHLELTCSWLHIDYSDSHRISTDLDLDNDQTRPHQQLLQSLSSSCLQQLAISAARFTSARFRHTAPATRLDQRNSQLRFVQWDSASPSEIRPDRGVGTVSTYKQKQNTTVQLIVWHHHISYACQYVNTPTVNIRLLVTFEAVETPIPTISGNRISVLV